MSKRMGGKRAVKTGLDELANPVDRIEWIVQEAYRILDVSNADHERLMSYIDKYGWADLEALKVDRP